MSTHFSYSASQLWRIRRWATPASPAPQLLSSLTENGLLHYRDTRAGCNTQRAIRRRITQRQSVVNIRQRYPPRSGRPPPRSSLLNVRRANAQVPSTATQTGLVVSAPLPPPSVVPSLYLTNPTGLYQANALQLLHSDLLAFDASLAAVCETWFKNKHSAGIIDTQHMLSKG